MSDLVLPKLKPDSDVRPSDEVGKWVEQSPKAFQDVASSLDYKSSGQRKDLSSVPTMWARPLSMEMALYNQYYPIRSELIEQWQGMLAAIALAEVRRFPLSVQLLDLFELSHRYPFARALYDLLPDPVNVLYTLEGKNPWQDVYVFLWDEKPVGITSPSTLICPSEEGKWRNLPWWNSKERRLNSPHYYLNSSEKALLWRWLEHLRGDLNKHQGQPKAIEVIGGLLDQFLNSLGVHREQRLSLSDNPQFFGIPINRGVLRAINQPVKAEPKSSSIRLIPSPEKGKIPDLLIIDPEIAKAWDESPQNIWVYGDQTLASLNVNDLKTGKIIWDNIRWIESKDLFLPKFTFIDIKDALPGAFLPSETQAMVFKGRGITPLLPLDPLLLDYFTPEELIRRIQITSINGGDGPVVRVALDLPLSGVNKEHQQLQNYRIYRDYPLKEENSLPEVPVLEVWPHFLKKDWQEYYAFYYDGEYGEQTFQVSLPTAKEPYIFQDRDATYQITRLEEFPDFIDCQNRDRSSLGLILLRKPEKIVTTGSWTVGVDFGTSFTNIYVNRKGKVEPLPLDNLHLKVTEVPQETRIRVLYEYFIPESFIPPEKPLPLSSVLTTRGRSNTSDYSGTGKERPIYDGRIYVPDRNRFQPDEDWMETDLKWKNFVPNRMFLKHLALHITALAAQKGVGQIQWSLSYPSAFSRGDQTRYAQTWRNLTRDLQAKTGIRHICPEIDQQEYFRTESLAVAQYFADQEGHNLVNSTCIDMGGGTSDISIWENNKLVHQCSVQLAGRHLLSQFLELNPRFLENRFGVSDLTGLTKENFSAKLDVLLRLEGDKWLEKRAFIEEESDFQGLVRLIALGVAGLYYYVGTILGVLFEEEKYNKNEITPVFIGGNGSRILNWLAIGGQFDRNSEVNYLLSRMLSKGSDFEDIDEVTRLSTRPKDEVACGLVLTATKLQGLGRREKDPLIAGENCEVNGQFVSWSSRLDLKGNIQNFHISELEQLSTFLDDFNFALEELEIDGLNPMVGFQPGVGIEARVKDKLWRDTQRELTSSLLKIKGDSENIREEPPFILALKALLRVLAKEWAGK
ncbi:MAG: hypothetical protein F6K58_11280 [Symploca sp. SIO2E9]|nr:hypothetical protein [Symploca sp. SIO2E9]